MENLLLLHGAIGAKDQLETLKKVLEQDYNVFSFDFSGHGGVGFGKSFDIEQFTEDTLSFCLANNLRQVSIFGYSMGGYVALNLASKHPEKVKSIVTLGTKFKWSPEIASKEVKMLDASIIEEKVPAFAKVLSKRHGKESWKILLSKTATMMLEMGDNNPLELSDFKKITTPCRLLLADKDEMVSQEETKEVNDALPNSTFTSINNSKHPIEKVDVDLLVKEIVNMI